MTRDTRRKAGIRAEQQRTGRRCTHLAHETSAGSNRTPGTLTPPSC
ncbi:hypothetical protein [Streptomyces sp. NPDC020362]